MTDACFRVSRLLERRASGLSEAERLVLERHLAACAGCREDSTLLRNLAELSLHAAESSQLAVPSERLLARAFVRATSDAPEQSLLEHAFAPRSPYALAFGFALLLACALGGAWLRHGRAAPLADAAEHNLSMVVAGTVSIGGRTLALGAVVPEHSKLSVAAQSELALAHARVRTEEATSLAWSEADSCVELADGAVNVSVDPKPKRPFAVKTPLFRVDVLGTEFHVDARSVSVSRGRVRISNAVGVEVAVLDAGQRWRASDALAQNAPPVGTADAVGGDSDVAEPAPTVARTVTAAESLALARHALASGDVSSARHAIDLALHAHPRMDEQAEAQMLLGDAARIAGNPDLSTSEYLQVFTRFRNLPLAETALFSAARVQAHAGHNARADQLFSSYLAAYPRGQFHAQALEHVNARASEKP
ncbi:MAG TPA: FecR domain-containing protein [Polyangiaceae bacterium]|jgi:hypothetical protein